MPRAKSNSANPQTSHRNAHTELKDVFGVTLATAVDLACKLCEDFAMWNFRCPEKDLIHVSYSLVVKPFDLLSLEMCVYDTLRLHTCSSSLS